MNQSSYRAPFDPNKTQNSVAFQAAQQQAHGSEIRV